jgi:signal transduction histidine kinase
MNETILLVDDEEGIRKILGITLVDSGYEVLTAASGEEALGIFRRTDPQIILTDIKMPGMDGLELLRRIKKEKPDAEVIMITGHGDLELAIQSLQFEASDFITKPINDDALEIALRRAHERIWMKARLREYTEGLECLVHEKTRKLLEAERLAAIGQTVATLAHAIKNIIGGLNGGIYVVEKGMELKKEEYLSQGWGMVKGNVDKIKNLALDLLNFAKEREPNYEQVNPNQIVTDIYHLMLERARECGIQLVLEVDKSLPGIPLDPEAIHCCLLNLISNAFDAVTDVENTGDRKEVILRTSKGEGGWIEYRVIDSGCGMDEDVKDKVFKSFFSTKGTRGTGLGLMITRKAVLEHGGEILLESEKGKGTTFTVRLPVKGFAKSGKPPGTTMKCRLAALEVSTPGIKGESYD